MYWEKVTSCCPSKSMGAKSTISMRSGEKNRFFTLINIVNNKKDWIASFINLSGRFECFYDD
jgi:hypothetical protein